MRVLASLTILIALTVSAPSQTSTTGAVSVSSGRLNDIRLVAPEGDPKAMVVYFSDRTGWKLADDTNVAALKGDGNAVLGVDMASYAVELDKADGVCLYVVAEITNLAQNAQRMLGIQTYLPPIVAGVGQGATFAYAALADAPSNTLGGAVGWDFRNELTLRLPFCPGSKSTLNASGKSWSYGFNVATPEAATIFVDTSLIDTIRKQASSQDNVFVEELDSATAADQLVQAVSTLSDVAEPFGGLPAVDLPSSTPTKAVAIFVSGDGGWRDIDKTMGEWLATRGVHVVGLDALRYFWSKRTPEQLAADIRTLAGDADPQANLPILLIGYSFGADTIPFSYKLLPPDMMDRVRVIGLLSPSQTASFQVTVTGWLGVDDGGYDVPGAIATLPKEKVVCIYGENETDSGCTNPALQGVETIKTGGGHHFDGNYQALAEKLLTAARL